jgi:hypothetical protein
LNGKQQRRGYFGAFKNAILHPSMSFAISLAILITPKDTKAFLNIITAEPFLDFFIRALSSSVSAVGSNSRSDSNLFLVALTNLFVNLLEPQHFNYAGTTGFSQFVERVCTSIQYSQEAGYLLKEILTVAAYENANGLQTFAIFLEIVIRPFSIHAKRESE